MILVDIQCTFFVHVHMNVSEYTLYVSLLLNFNLTDNNGLSFLNCVPYKCTYYENIYLVKSIRSLLYCTSQNDILLHKYLVYYFCNFWGWGIFMSLSGKAGSLTDWDKESDESKQIYMKWRFSLCWPNTCIISTYWTQADRNQCLIFSCHIFYQLFHTHL